MHRFTCGQGWEKPRTTPLHKRHLLKYLENLGNTSNNLLRFDFTDI